MKQLKISGYGDDLTVNNIRIGDLSPDDHAKIEENLGGKAKYAGKSVLKD